jgi:hypothetical protein
MVVRITRARPGARLKLFGVAWGGDEPLERVEISVDGGAWRTVRLEPQPQPAAFAWTFWSQEIDALADGAHTVAARAANRGGQVQPESLDEKKTYWEDNAIFRRPFKLG